MPFRIALCALWLAGIGAGFAVVLKYQNTEGRAGVTPQHWPAGTLIALDPDRDTLVMFAHPRCPCTRASLDELNRLLARTSGKVRPQVWFVRPAGLPAGWTETDLWRSAAALPGVTVREDAGGAQASLFGAETSGYVVLYDPRGRLLFKGGITGSRGHAGDNAGENAVVSLLIGGDAALSQTRVFGCSLLGQCEAPSRGIAR
jgi:hypothetical protein